MEDDIYETLEKIKRQIDKLDEVFVEDIEAIEEELDYLNRDNDELRSI